RDQEGCVSVRDWPSGSVSKQIDLGRHGWILSLTASGRTLAAQFPGTWTKFHPYDLKTGQAMPFPADALGTGVSAVEALPEGSVLSLGRDNVLRTWDPASGRQTQPVLLEEISSEKSFSLGPNGHLAAVDGATLVIFDRDTAQPLRRITTPLRCLDGVIFS